MDLHRNTRQHLQLDKAHSLRTDKAHKCRTTVDCQDLLTRMMYQNREAAAFSVVSEVRRSSPTLNVVTK
jgi:hypothetical protein